MLTVFAVVLLAGALLATVAVPHAASVNADKRVAAMTPERLVLVWLRPATANDEFVSVESVACFVVGETCFMGL